MEHTPTPPTPPSVISVMAKGALRLGLVGAVLGGGALAAALGGMGAFDAGLSGLKTIGSTLGIEALTTAAGAGSAALVGLIAGAAGGAALGATAGATAAPIFLKQKQTEAVIPIVAQQAMQQGYAMGEAHGKQAMQEIAQESTKFRDMISAQRSQQPTPGHSVV